MSKIGVVGCGFVGSAVADGFESLGEEVVRHDPPKGLNNWGGIYESDFAFLCLPTLARDDGSCDVSIVAESLYRLHETVYSGVTVIKSTVDPFALERAAGAAAMRYAIANPEFLTERTAQHDFLHPTHIVIGGNPDAGANSLAALYRQHWPVVPVEVTGDFASAMLAKYVLNCLFATKVTLMNQFEYLCRRHGIQWPSVARAIAIDPRCGREHVSVPGPDGKFGYGGHCFPKDVQAAIHMMKRGVLSGPSTPLSVLEAVDAVNESIRNPY